VRDITKEEKSEIISLTIKDITSKKLKDLFAVRPGQDHPRFEPNDKFVLMNGDNPNFKLSTPVQTTVGRYIFNVFVLPEPFIKKFGYSNAVMSVDGIDDIQNKLADMVLHDECATDDYIHFLNYGEWLGMNTAFFMLPSMDYKINHPIPEVIKRRDELFDKYKKELAEGDPNVVAAIEKDLLDMAKKDLKKSGNPSFDFFDSGEFKFGNNYKKSSIMGGAFLHPSTKKIMVSKSNYMDGITAEDYPIYTQLTVAGAYSRGVATQDGGYETKKINASMQNVVLDEAGTDCGTTMGVELVLTAPMSKLLDNRYIIENGTTKLLTKSNIKSYIGKKIKLRSPLYCKNPRCCNKCAGELYYKLDIPNAGLITSAFSGKLMNLSMKTMHDASLKFKHIQVEDYIKER